MFNILFVDDDINILKSLKRNFHKYRDQYKIYFAISGLEGLDILEDDDIDLVVSDMKMPNMDGAKFLSIVAEKFPNTIRLILTGEMDRDQAYRVIKSAHQFLAKPINMEKLLLLIKKAEFLKTVISKTSVVDILNKIKIIPSLPKIYYKINSMINNPNFSLEQIASVIETDTAMSLKVLQLVNSAFFGSGDEITSVKVAVRYIGLNILKDLILMFNVFEVLDNSTEEIKTIFKKIYSHSVNVAKIIKLLAENLNFSKKEQDKLFTLGIIHDIGKIVLLINFSEDFLNTVEISNNEKIPLRKLEKDIFGTTHYLISAYIIGIWGLSEEFINLFLEMDENIDFEQENIKNILYFANQYEKIKTHQDIEYFDDAKYFDKDNDLIKKYINIIEEKWNTI